MGTSYHHFSHPHPLEIIICNQQTKELSPSSSCPGCNLKPSGVIYSCTICEFLLHKKCFEMPKMITHVGHKGHPFTLLPEPTYATGFFRCDACWGVGNGFSYHCRPCGMDLHLLCAALPLTITHAAHAHKLHLVYGSPYANKNFICDICKAFGQDHWLYRCGSCGFDAHLGCAAAGGV
ncbi:hypothetical protein ABFS82_02G127000 [Erythranthe guttata]|uniref:DC1 domain-containing protein n=1 Tax=Erythranthe guttata TaxID=4155 RepID=A0A022QEN2_ERYGU|nr:PREDICTED: uncharacterized protein LOC105969466 [Erythranthe guttata]EYU27132.1 hypothetical protein MIMGU_mgv1a025339mg [Erythranthe guttata]|eukprot:XP_012849671.1 PREDICTED: uncharacterized protein LOC105969466 [Erythranthe guttata]